MNLFLNKKGISPLISIILIIVVTIILITIVMNWGTDVTQKATAKADAFKNYDKVDGLISIKAANNGKLLLLNNSDQDIIILGYNIWSEDSNHEFLNTLITLDQNVVLNSLQQSELEIACFPESNFTVDLYLDDGTYTSIVVNSANPTESNCLDYYLIGKYEFNDLGSLTIKDTSGNGNDGTVFGNTISNFWSKGKNKGNIIEDSCVYFDPEPFEICTKEKQQYTVTMWIKPDSLPVTSSTALFWNMEWGPALRYGLYINGGESTFRSTVRTIDGEDTKYASNIPSYNSLVEDWQFISAVVDVDNGVHKLYYNGDFDRQSTLYGNTITCGVDPEIIPPAIGSYKVNDVILWDYFGEVGETRFYNRVLSDNEIKEIYNLKKSRYI